MTLLVTEIHNHDAPARSLIVFGADRRISLNYQFYDKRKKIFEIPRLNAAIGYFGLAKVGARPMADWLNSYLQRDTSNCLADFANTLATSLNAAVSASQRDKISGFHVSGFTSKRRAEFWFVRNITDDGRPTGTYEAREDFQGRDAPTRKAGEVQIYRNGDLRAHVQLWGKLDEAIVPLLNHPDFKTVRSPIDYAQWVRFKLEVIAYLYKKWCNLSIIGPPIDIICVTPSGVRKVSRDDH